MAIWRNILVTFLICAAGVGFGAAQVNPKQTWSRNRLPERSVEIKANVKVLDAAGNFASDVKLENLRVFEDEVEQKLTYFVRKEPVLNLAIVIDNSGSMRRREKQYALAGTNLVDSLAGKDEAFLVRFVSSDKIETIQDWTSSKPGLKEGIENMFLEGGQSAVIDALYLSAEKLLEREIKDRSARYAIVLVSDAEERDSYYKLAELLALFKGSDIQIFTIAMTADLRGNNNPKSEKRYTKETSEDFARLFALETGGSTYVLDGKYTDEDVTRITKLVADELRSQYIIGYTSTNKNRDGSARKLRVSVADRDKGERRQAFIRESFVVPKELP